MRFALVPLTLAASLAACGGTSSELSSPDASPTPDAAPDAGASVDGAAAPDAGLSDTGAHDASPPDVGVADAGSADAGPALGPDEVRTAAGVVRGVRAGAVWAFKGVPFAAPPVGGLRLAAPAPHPGWDGVLEADDFSPVCPQVDRRGNLSGDEDCLALNVWTARQAGLRPVMVWIHGGGHVQGSASVPLYDGAKLVEDGDVVVVSINYRLGALGYLALDALRDGAPAGQGANFGVQDQIAALEWVRDNIEGFGGDPANVTIFGESAGAVSVETLLGADRAQGLFHRAAAQSGGGGYSASEWAHAIGVGAQVVEQVGCEGAADLLACLRGVDAGAFVTAQGNVSQSGLGLPDFGPTLDGDLLVEQAYLRLAAGQGSEVPVLVGSNADEAVTFTAGIPVPNRRALLQVLRGFVGASLAPMVAALYPASDFPDAKRAFDAAYGDIAFNCRAQGLARVTAGGASESFHYYFSHVLDGQAGAQGSLHGHEIPFVFGTVDAYGALYTPTASDRLVASAMLLAWARFAHTGAPAGAPAWPAYDPQAPQTMVFDDPIELATTFRAGRCDALRGLGLVR